MSAPAISRTGAPPAARAAARSAPLSADPLLVGVVIALGVAGIALSSSARAYWDAVGSGLPVGLAHSLVHFCLGLVVMTAVVVPDYRRLTHPALVWIVLAATSLLLVVALAGPEIHGTHRWLSLFGFSLQPSELAKPVLVVAVASTLSRAGSQVREWAGLSRPLIIGAWLSALVLLGRDLGTPVLLGCTTLALAFASGARMRHSGVLLGAGGLLFTLFAAIEPYRMARLASFASALRLRPGAIDEVHHQLGQSLVAIGSGGLFGKGFGSSTQKAFFLPEPDNDFVFAIIAEELGLIGALAVLAAFVVLAWRGLRASERAPDELGRLIALGATWLLTGQALCHIGVVTGLLPTKGLPLPFLSTGGSSMIAAFALVGLVLNVSLRRRRHGD